MQLYHSLAAKSIEKEPTEAYYLFQFIYLINQLGEIPDAGIYLSHQKKRAMIFRIAMSESDSPIPPEPTNEAFDSPEYRRFNALVDRVLAVPRSEILNRIGEHRKLAAVKTNRPGPKPKKSPEVPGST